MAEMNTYLQDQDVKDFTREIQQYHLGPLWEAIPAIMNKTPSHKLKPIFGVMNF